MSTLVVAIVLYIKTSQKYLIVRRNESQSGAGYWEFPGGKVELEETHQQALQREIFEELHVVIDPLVLQFLFKNEHQYEAKKIAISFYLYEISQIIPIVLVDHDDFKWCDIKELLHYQMAPADIPVINYLIQQRGS